MSRAADISMEEYKAVVVHAKEVGAQQVNVLGGEPTLHTDLKQMLEFNCLRHLKSTVYTNGYFLDKSYFDMDGVKYRASVYRARGPHKSLDTLNTDKPVDICFMVSKNTSVSELLEVANDKRCRILFISSIRELDNPRKEFFDDTENTMPVIQYKELVHSFLHLYVGGKEIHVSKRGVFESTLSIPHNRCHFTNYMPGGRVIQCPYDIVNLVYAHGVEFNNRFCRQSSTCLMSKVVYQRI